MKTTVKITNIQPTVHGFCFEVPTTSERLEINMDNLFQWMHLHQPEDAQTAGQFNQSIENMKQHELSATLAKLVSMQPDLCHPAPFCGPQAPAPAPSIDQYDGFTEDECPVDPDDLEQSNEDLQMLHSITAQLATFKIQTVNHARDIKAIINMAQQFLQQSTTMHHGLPTLDNLLSQYIIKRRSVKVSKEGIDTFGKKNVISSKTWLESNICTPDILCLLRGDKVRVSAKSGKGHTMYQLNPIKKHG